MKIAEAKAILRGRWLEVFQALASEELGAAMKKPGDHVPCPVHGGSDGFRLFRDAPETGGGVCNTCGSQSDGLYMLAWIHGWSIREAINEAMWAIGEDPEGRRPAQKAPKPPKPPKVDWTSHHRRQKELRRLWSEAVVPDSIQTVARYLESRGLDPRIGIKAFQGQVRYHPNLPHRDPETGRKAHYPALISLFRDPSGKAVTIHRTWLTRGEEGVTKAPVSNPRMMFPVPNGWDVSGAAIRLGGLVSETVNIAEGIETALAVAEGTGETCWALASTGMIRAFRPPEGVTKVVIWADRDDNNAGINAAQALKERMWKAGIQCAIRLPAAGTKADWNDILIQQGRDAIQSA